MQWLKVAEDLLEHVDSRVAAVAGKKDGSSGVETEVRSKTVAPVGVWKEMATSEPIVPPFPRSLSAPRPPQTTGLAGEGRQAGKMTDDQLLAFLNDSAPTPTSAKASSHAKRRMGLVKAAGDDEIVLEWDSTPTPTTTTTTTTTTTAATTEDESPTQPESDKRETGLRSKSVSPIPRSPRRTGEDPVVAAVDRENALLVKIEELEESKELLRRECLAALEQRNERIQSLQENIGEAIEAIVKRDEVIANLVNDRKDSLEEKESVADAHGHELAHLRSEYTAIEKLLEQEQREHEATRKQAQEREALLQQDNAEYARALALAQRRLQEAQVSRGTESPRDLLAAETLALGEEIQELERRLTEERASMNVVQAKAEGYVLEISALREEKDAVRRQMGETVETQRREIAELEKQLALQTLHSPNPRNYDDRLRNLTEHLERKQRELETLTSEKAALQLAFEKEAKRLRELELLYDGRSSTPFPSTSHDVEKGDAGPRLRPIASVLSRRVTSQPQISRAAHLLDSLAVHAGLFLRRNPIARLMFFFYVLVLHVWVLYVLSSSSPHATTTETPLP